MRVLDALIDLIKVRDQLANMEEKLQHLRRVVDGSVNEIMDFMQEQNLIKVADVGDSDCSGLEQPMVGGSSTQGESSVGTDSEHEEWYPLQDGPGD
jgi:hypothetical protein